MKTPTLGRRNTPRPSKSRSHPPASPDRDQILGGLVGVVAGGPTAKYSPIMSCASGMRAYSEAGPAWLLPLAILCPDPDQAAATAARLAADADVAPKDRALWVEYVALASDLTATATPPPGVTTLVLCGQSARDALAASRWALGQDRFDAVTAGLTTCHAAPSAAAAALGLWGLTHGAAAIPSNHRGPLGRVLDPTVTAVMCSRTARPQPCRSMLDDLLGVA